MKEDQEDEMDNVYVLIFLCKTSTELLGVYSTEEKAKNAYNLFLSKMSGFDYWNGLTICIRKMDAI